MEDLVLQINDVLNRTNSVSLSDTLGRLTHIRQLQLSNAFFQMLCLRRLLVHQT